ncbi:(2Fe-2S)-binding protein [Ancylobacter sp. MQZ15Z-1]|uniref:(2Fe-2S)-binding protein n=1 Tax=Ancylobacter mangrovi TaxID=2972472 RepID=A0A9X2PFS3_9HYPH|nr:(2Fe-2S)-binding protein [Ancylobacter mangrovi]MCS0496564.1 (2Fe-2S)-binding protein [Ancylobacter mangrovi]
MDEAERRLISVTVNEVVHRAEVDVRLTLADFLRHTLQLTGTHVGCEHGVCGACTVLVGGHTARSCLMLAVQAHGHSVVTIEGLSTEGQPLPPLQQALADHHGLQCGFCTPGILTTLTELLRDNPSPSDEDIRVALSGNICRCTGYQGIVAAVRSLLPSAGREVRG